MAGLSQENKLRDVFNPRVITELAERIHGVWAEFDKAGFLDAVLPALPDLGFGERSALLRESLHDFLPPDYPTAVSILIDALGPELTDPDIPAWDGFPVMAQCSFVSKYGQEHFDLSMNALYEMTKRFSAEGDLRTFIEVDFDRAMSTLHTWAGDSNPFVRRLVSEGTRPRLPLAGRIRRFQKDPRPVIALLDRLKDDPTLYVRRSVANNINDIAKDNPELAVAALKRWSRDRKPETQWLVRHAARTLVKQGNQGALSLLGFSAAPRVSVSDLAILPRRPKLGSAVTLAFTVRSRAGAPQNLVVDFALHYRKANGSLLPKVFKLRNITLPTRGRVALQKKIQLRHTSGRKIFPGRHEIEILVNGKSYTRGHFTVA